MLLKDIINKSVYGTIGYIDSQESLDLLEQYIVYNLPILSEFKQVIVATNYKEYPTYVSENSQLWKKYFPDCILLDSKINRGHQLGTADLDNMLVNYCKSNNIDWLCKSANDVILTPHLLTKEVDAADFYFLMSVGVAGLRQHNFDLEDAFNNAFTPQTNFYIINISKIDELNSEHDMIHVTICENMLERCVLRNNLKKYNLIPNDKYIKLIHMVYNTQIHDSSHKNILIEGVCHYHFPNQISIEL